jgi:exodeoxyribonuclease VII large subunit
MSRVPDNDDETEEPIVEESRSVSELIADVNRLLVREFKDVWIYGEVGARVSKPTSGHCYFDLVEEVDGEQKTVSVKLFKGVWQSLAPMMSRNGIDIVPGIKVRIRGTPEVYDKSGAFGFKMNSIDPRFTLGDLAAKRAEIVERLQKERLYDRNRSTVLPLVPLSIGLVTSKGTAAHADFMTTLAESGIGFRISLCDVRVQGDDAAPGIISAIKRLAADDAIDVIAVVRGGGSKVDLAVFDDEMIARAIAASRKPVFTGIGHEVDTSIADEVAYESHKTPTACATAIVDRVRQYQQRIELAAQRIAALVAAALSAGERRVESAAQRLATVVVAALASGERRVADAYGRLRTLRTSSLNAAKARIDSLEKELRSLDPVNVMRRGWSITRDADGRVLRSIKQATQGTDVTTRLADGTVTSTVRSTNVAERE